VRLPFVALKSTQPR